MPGASSGKSFKKKTGFERVGHEDKFTDNSFQRNGHNFAESSSSLQSDLPEVKNSLPRLAYLSPLLPAHTGIANYSSELLPELSKYFVIDVVVDQPEVSDGWVLKKNIAIRNVEWLFDNYKSYFAVIYHIGNSAYHKWMLPVLEEIPGIVVLHDFYLGALIWDMDQSRQFAGIKWRETWYSHGYPALLELTRAGNSHCEQDISMRYPVNRHVLEQALGVIVHSDISRKLSMQWYGHTARNWFCIPHLRHPVESVSQGNSRLKLGLSDKAFIVCSFGGLGLTKLNDRLLSAWAVSILARDPCCMLVFVGELNESPYAIRLRQLIHATGLSSRIRVTGWTDEETFKHYLESADLAVQLRTLSRGETSGTVLDCMNYSLPTIVNANGSMADIPEEGVFRLADDFTDAELINALELLYADPQVRLALGARARALIVAQHDPVICAARYSEAIMQVVQAGSQSSLGTMLSPGSHAGLPPSSPFQPKQLLLDVTATCHHDGHTGIERVVRALVVALQENPPFDDLRVEPVYLCCHDGVWQYRYACSWTSRLLALGYWLDDQPAIIQPGDQLLALDISGDAFVMASQAGLFQHLQAQGVVCRMLLHDLLPLTCPQYFPPDAQRYFGRWLAEVIRLDGAVCVSHTVETSLKDWLQANFPEKAHIFHTGYSHHGADITNTAPTLGFPEGAPALLARLAEKPTILMVGTLEPRKGYWQALEAFSLLWQQQVTVNLVIVGREGWKDLPDVQRRDIPDLMRWLTGHPERDRHLFWLEGISDEYLEQVYACSDGLLAASWDEGFGLPLIEAAQKGLPLLVRDIPVFHEIAGEHACYFRAEYPEQLAGALRDWLMTGFQPASAGMPWQTWQQSSTHLASQLLKHP